MFMGYYFLQTLKGGLGVSLQFTAIFSQNVGWVGGRRGCQDEWRLDCLFRFSTLSARVVWLEWGKQGTSLPLGQLLLGKITLF